MSVRTSVARAVLAGALLVLGACSGAATPPPATEAAGELSETASDEPPAPAPTPTPSPQPSPTEIAADPPAYEVTGVIGVQIKEVDDDHLGRITCYGFVAEDGTEYNLAISPPTGLQWGAMVTSDGERARGSTTKTVVGQDVEDAATGQMVATVGDRVAITAESGGHDSLCDLPVLVVVALEVLGE